MDKTGLKVKDHQFEMWTKKKPPKTYVIDRREKKNTENKTDKEGKKGKGRRGRNKSVNGKQRDKG